MTSISKNKLNLFKFIINYQLLFTELSHSPFLFWIEPTNICNLKCVTCPQSLDHRGEKGVMDLELYKIVLEQVNKLKPTALMLHLAGEPLIHPMLDKMVRLAKETGIYTQFATNGTMLHREKADKLLDAGIDAIDIAFCENREVFSKLRGGADWQVVYENIVDFLKAKKRRGKPYPFVQITNIDTNSESSVGKISKLFSDLPYNNIINFEVHSWGGDFASQMKNDMFFTRMRKNSYYPCSHLWSSMVIRWNGEVVPCCRDLEGDFILGDVKKENLRDIWNNSKAIYLRKIHKNNKYQKVKLCRNCTKLWEGEKPYHLVLQHIKFSIHRIVSAFERKFFL